VVAHSPFGKANGCRLRLEGRMVEMKVSYHGESRAADATSAFLKTIGKMGYFQMVMDSPLVYDHGQKYFAVSLFLRREVGDRSI
jgi:hypothetical protein